MFSHTMCTTNSECLFNKWFISHCVFKDEIPIDHYKTIYSRTLY